MLKKSIFTAISFSLLLCVSHSQAGAFPNFTQNEFTTAESLDPGSSSELRQRDFNRRTSLARWSASI
jgi:hypothetical protein